MLHVVATSGCKTPLYGIKTSVGQVFQAGTEKSLILEGLMVFFEFWSGSYGMSLKPKNFIFLGLILVFEIYLRMKFFFKIICRFGDIKV